MRSIVSLQNCREYDSTRVREAVARALLEVPATTDLLRSGRRILLKPNIVNPRGPERPVCTHPQVLRAVAEICHEAGCLLLVADQPTYWLTGRTGSQQFAAPGLFHTTGYVEVCKGLPVDWALCASAGYREFPVPRPYHVPVAHLTRLLDEVDGVINLPKLKTHMQTRLTGAVKNTFGLVAPRQRMDLHMLGNPALSEAIVDTFAAYRPELSVLDAVVAMEGAGPVRGPARQTGWIAASSDAVALDALAGHLCGFRPRAIRTTTAAAEARYGVADLGQIAVEGADPETLRVRLRPPHSPPMRWPTWLGRLGRRLIYARPRVVPNACIGCGGCREACPAKCITIEDYARIDRQRCLECFCCMEACPRDAIAVDESLLTRLLR